MSGTLTKLPPLSRSFDLSRASINEESRTVDVTFSTEAPVSRWFGEEILDHNPKSVRMERLKNGAAVLWNHNLDKQRGVVQSAEMKKAGGTATLRISRSEDGEELWNDIRDGIVTKVSVGYRVHKMILESSGDKGNEVYRITDWEPFEISFVSVPADDSAGVRSEETAKSLFGQRAAELSTLIDMSKPAENQVRASGENQEPATAPVAPVQAEPATRALEPQKPALTEAEIEAIASRKADEEANRREEIKAIGRALSMDDKDISKAIKDKESVESFKLRVFDELAKKNPAFAPGEPVVSENKPEPGSRAAMLTHFGTRAAEILKARGVNIIVPDYSRLPEVAERNYVDNGNTIFHRSMAGAVTLIDVAKIDEGIGSPLISEVAVLAPEVRTFPVDTIQGAAVSLSVMTESATVGFRNANEGTTPSIGKFESRLYETQVLEHPVVIDIQGVMNASKDPGRLMESTTRSVLEGVFKHIGVQTWYAGTTQSAADSKAAPGLLAQASSASTHVVDADGTNNLSSAYMVRLGDGYCDHVYGNGTTLNFSDWMEETWKDASGKALRAMISYISGRFAPRLANKNALVRIKKLGTDSGKGLTDALLFDAYSKFTTLGQEPNAIYMTPRSLEQLRKSRTATNPTGAPAPIPTDWNGIPIYVTNSISLAETV